MKKLLLITLLNVTFLSMNAQLDVAKLRATKTGTFAGLTYSTPDLEKGKQLFEQLNYKELKRNDNSIYLSDGSLLIKLEQGNDKKYELTYYSDDPKSLLKQFADNGVAVNNNHIVFQGVTIVVREKVFGVDEQTGVTFLTMKPNDFMDGSKFPNEKCGVFGEYAIPVEDLDEAIAWWEKLGFKAPMKMSQPYPHAIMSDGYMIVGLHQTTEFREPSMTYFAPDMESRVKSLREEGTPGIEHTMGDNDKNVVVTMPGGQSIFLFSMGM